MGQINILSENVFNTIAAGEVIERPASVIKEVVENSIDAGAASIKIGIEKAGIKTISVLDSGVGMDNEDALLCFEPHATSKIKNEADIFNIRTMGFRGEALPSIAAVSKVRLRTKLQGTVEGWEIVINGGKFITERPAGCAPGTEIIISDLFYNVPARKKFLKGEITEEKHIHEVVTLLALAHHEISFEFKADGKVIFSSSSANNLEPRLALLLGREVVDNSIFITGKNFNVAVSGYVSTPGMVRNTRRDQRFFVNRRPVRSQFLYSLVKEAYSTLIMGNVCPIVTLFIDIDPSDIDVNVHPAKHEIRFRKEKIVAEVIVEAIKKALCESIKPLSSVSNTKVPFNAFMSSAKVEYEVKSEKPINVDFLPEPIANDSKNSSQTSFVKQVERGEFRSEKPSGTDVGTIDKDLWKLSLPGCGYIEIVGILDKTYIVGLSDVGLIIIDQHAAHERIIFEKLLKDHTALNLSQELLIPITVELSKSELNFLKKYIALFRSLGFGLEFFGDGTLLVTSIPKAIEMDNVSEMLSDLLNALIEGKESLKKIDEEAIARCSCKIAVKANDKLTLLESRKLILDLSKCDLPFSCPHGRPTVINVSKAELEKRFGRVL